MSLVEFKERHPITKTATLCFLVKDNQILLALKKRGFGMGKYNGVGGKPKPNEDILSAAIRETQEEIGVTPKSLAQVASLDFYFAHNPEWNQRVVVYLSSDWTGQPIESEEMAPKWHTIDELPYDSMWADDIHWLPLVLGGKLVQAEFLFDKDESILDQLISEVKSFTI